MYRNTLTCVFVIELVFLIAYCASENINIGGVFDVDQDQHDVFKHAIKLVNNKKSLGRSRLIDISSRVLLNNEFQVSKSVCSILPFGVFGIFGPNSEASHFVQSVCDTLEIPHIETGWHYRHERQSCQVNIHPHPAVIARVFIDIIKLYNWKSFTIIYENDNSWIRISELLTLSESGMYHMTFQQLDTNYTGNYRPALTDVKRSGEKCFVLDCSIAILPEVLKQALQVGLISDSYNYIITNLDLHTLDLFPYRHGGANITGIQLVDPSDENIIEVARSFEKMKFHHRPDYVKIAEPEKYVRVEAALMYDAVTLFAKALKQLNISKIVHARPLYCNESYSWEHGYSLINYMRTNSIDGLTGHVKFDYQGYRTDFVLNIIELNNTGLHNIGTWNSTEGLKIEREFPNVENDTNADSLHNKSFIVLIALTDPYGMLKEASQTLTGNDRFEGFGIDLIHELSLILGFNYTFKLQEDGQYGSYDKKTGQWDGMIRELQEGRAHLAITDLTITAEREAAVDFTHPFMNLGISILYKKPMTLPPHLFSFMSPFSTKVWYCLGGACIGVSLLLYILARLSPAEWTNRYPCIDEPDFLENQFTFRNCFWFTLGSLMTQGSELAAIAMSTRMVAGTWWFFTIIMGSSYTANLAAFLTVESQTSPFKTVEELASQNVIKYGAKLNGATATFFNTSQYSVYQKIGQFMVDHPEYMTSSNPDGVKRAETEDYAFFMESTTIEYTIERHCNLSQIGRLLDDKGYGIAMKKNSSYRHNLSKAVLRLQESGKLQQLKMKWWKEKRGGGRCQKEEAGGNAKELGLPNLGGVFFVLVVGSLAGFFVGIVEVLLDVMKLSVKNNVSFKQELKEELKFLLNLRQRNKPLRYSKSRAPSKQSLNDFTYPQNAPYGFIPVLNPNAVK